MTDGLTARQKQTLGRFPESGTLRLNEPAWTRNLRRDTVILWELVDKGLARLVESEGLRATWALTDVGRRARRTAG